MRPLIGSQILSYPTLQSTNRHAADLLSKTRPPEGTVVVARDQTAGRGQIGSHWISEAGSNLTFTVILYPQIPVDKQFTVNMVLSLGLVDAMQHCFDLEAKIKWPNDLYIGDRKIGGLLIQSVLQGGKLRHMIAGIGLNINQTEFPEKIPNPTSVFLETARACDVAESLDQVLHHLDHIYRQLRSEEYEAIRDRYHKMMYRRYRKSTFSNPDGTQFEGRISGVDEHGKLIVLLEVGEALHFGFREVRLVL